MLTAATNPRRSAGIDALRGAAVLMVLLHHSYVPHIGIAMYEAFLIFFKRYGALGVDLFFVLSGFCIHSAYSKPDKIFEVKPYLLRRWWRIYPPYFIALCLAVILNLITNYIKWKTGGALTPENYNPVQILVHIFLIHNMSPLSETTISGPFWTIAMEAQYYLVYLAVRRFFFSQRGWAGIFIVAFGVYITAWALQQEPWSIQPLSPFRYWIEWLFGAYVVFWLKQKPALPKYVGRHAICVAMCLFAGVVLSNYETNIGDLFSRLFYAAAFAFLILLALGWEALWESRALKWLPGVGIFSYSIYLTHFLLMDRIRVFVIPTIDGGWLRMGASVSLIAFCIGAAYLFFIHFEKPFIEQAHTSVRRRV